MLRILQGLSVFLKYATWLKRNLVAQIKARDKEMDAAADLGPSVLKQRHAG